MNHLDAIIQTIAGKEHSQRQYKDAQTSSKTNHHSTGEHQYVDLKQYLPVTMINEPPARPPTPKPKRSWATQAYDQAWWDTHRREHMLDHARQAMINAQGNNQWFDETYEYCPQEEIYRPRSHPLGSRAQGQDTATKRCRSEGNLQSKAAHSERNDTDIHHRHPNYKNVPGAVRSHQPGGAVILRNYWERHRRLEKRAQQPAANCDLQFTQLRPVLEEKERRPDIPSNRLPTRQRQIYCHDSSRDHIVSHHRSTNLDARVATAKNKLPLPFNTKHDLTKDCAITDTKSNIHPDAPQAHDTEAVQQPVGNRDPHETGRCEPPKHTEVARDLHNLEPEAVGKHQPEVSQPSKKHRHVTFQEFSAQPRVQRRAPVQALSRLTALSHRPAPPAAPRNNTLPSHRANSPGVSLLTAALERGAAPAKTDTAVLNQQAFAHRQSQRIMERLRSEGRKTRIPVYLGIGCRAERDCKPTVMLETDWLMPVP
jgi:hypothetical protein